LKQAPAHSDRAFVLRVSPYGDADAVVQLLTEKSGVVPALARRARASSPKRAMMIEPFHTLLVEIADKSGELAILRSAAIDTARASLLDHPTRLETAGVATRWARALSPPRAPEPEVFAAMERLLDVLAEGGDDRSALTSFGLVMLDTLGYGLDLSSCARCGRARPTGRAGYVSGASGGVICESCRRGVTIDAPLISGATLDGLSNDPWFSIHPDEGALVLGVVRDAITARAQAVGVRLQP
jgi:DNA repair protein RecO (recombination protein O)